VDALTLYFNEVSKLSDCQLTHLPSVEWLLNIDNYRGAGRSHLMAVVFLNQALRYPGKWIKIFDHIPGVEQRHIILNDIDDIILNDIDNMISSHNGFVTRRSTGEVRVDMTPDKIKHFPVSILLRSHVLKYAYQTIRVIMKLGISPEEIFQIVNDITVNTVMSE